ncbi:MAG: SgcJ/EcaC family oxidoreductase [Azospirillaceae bacterium]|nr:SgcJ/EcaC family oxidoreductase [Azospirillaceae bacterium]
MRLSLPLALLLSLTITMAQAATPESLPDQFTAAWNTHDPQAFEKLYTVDAVWVPVAEERTEGRDAIIAEFTKIHTGGGWAMKTTISKKDVPEVHLLRPDVATIFFHMNFLMNGQPVPGLQRALILVATAKDGDWKIAAGQLTKESPTQ